jgi:hypothetical protein
MSTDAELAANIETIKHGVRPTISKNTFSAAFVKTLLRPTQFL